MPAGTRRVRPSKIRALLFDFDGLILDTETSVFESWRVVYAEWGQSLSRESWQRTIGTDGSGFDPLAELRELAGPRLDVDAMQARRREIRDTHPAHRQTLPGVRTYLEQARQREMRVAIASSSPSDWVEVHVERLGLLHYFDAIVTRDDVRAAKPAPDLYLKAMSRLGVEPHEAIAFEDSPNGVRAAKAAGVYCIAVPGPMTRGLAFDHADAVLDALSATPLEASIRMARSAHTGVGEAGI